jgi:hypothetical protein
MFFRRKRAAEPTFSERLENVKSLGFAVSQTPAGPVRISRDGCAVELAAGDATDVRITNRAGVLMGAEIGVLVDGGFQKFFRTPTGKRKPATAEELTALHDFDEDLKEGLGVQSYYNESLGTVSTFYLYDRVKDRDTGVPKRAWE